MSESATDRSGSPIDRGSGKRMAGWRIPGLVLMQLLPRTWRASRREGMIENRPVLTFVQFRYVERKVQY